MRSPSIRVFGWVGVALAASLLACSEAPSAPGVDEASLRELSTGRVVGFENDAGGHTWLGVPFAQPPVGPLRWRAPQPPLPASEIREALTYGPGCVQFASVAGADGPDGEPAGSEDCLTLDIYAPRLAPNDVPGGVLALPVMVWIHGGGNSQGLASLYDGSTLATQRQVIVVAIQYRLGVFGWFRHPALHEADASAEDRSGNYGTLDTIRGLEWVRDEIGAFGGDPTRVTIFGESAGGTNVLALLRSPRAEGLFQRAVSQSGSATGVTVAAAENYVDDSEPGDPESSREVVLRLIQRTQGIERSAARAKVDAMADASLEQTLRELPAFDLLGLFANGELGPIYSGPRLFQDGAVLSELPALEAYERGEYSRVPVMLGSNRDEWRTFALITSPHMRRVFGTPIGLSNERMYLAATESLSRGWKAIGVDEPASRMRRVQGPSVYGYRFDWDAEPGFLWFDVATWLGAGHALEIPFVFGRFALGDATGLVFDPERAELDQQLSERMTSYWTQFAYTGDPGRGRDGDLPLWENWDPDGGSFLVLDAADDGGVRMSGDTVTAASVVASVARDPRVETREERCELYRGLARWDGVVMSLEAYAAAEEGACVELLPPPDR